MNEARWTARKLQFLRLGMFPAGMTRGELQVEWKKLVKEGKVPVLLGCRQPVPGASGRKKKWKRRKH